MSVFSSPMKQKEMKGNKFYLKTIIYLKLKIFNIVIVKKNNWEWIVSLQKYDVSLSTVLEKISDALSAIFETQIKFQIEHQMSDMVDPCWCREYS